MNKSRSIFIKKTKEWTEHEVSFVSEVLEHTFENMLNGNELNHEVSVLLTNCLLYTSPSPRDLSTSRMPSSA